MLSNFGDGEIAEAKVVIFLHAIDLKSFIIDNLRLYFIFAGL